MYPLSITVLSIRFELRGYLIKVPAGGWCEKRFPSGWPLVPIRTNWLQTKFLVLNFSRKSLNVSPLCKNCLSDRFISDQNLTLVFMSGWHENLLPELHKKVLWKDAELLVTEIEVSMFSETQTLFSAFCWKWVKVVQKDSLKSRFRSHHVSLFESF